MHVPLSKKLLSVLFLACALLSPIMPAQAAEPDASLSVTFDNPIQFLEPGGGQVFVPSGTYSVTAKPDQLILGSQEGASISLDAAEATHSNAVPFPLVVSTSGLDADLAGFHLLVVLYPDGHTLQAVGTYPKVTSRGILEFSEESLEYFDPALVTFGKPVYFIAPDGSPVVIEPGTYTAEAASPWIRLIPGQDRHKALLIEAQQGTHDTGIEDLLALSLPGGTLQEVDLHEVMLLLPTGQSLEADGSYSGIQKRGFWNKKKKSKKVKKRRNLFRKLGNHYKKIKKSRAFKKVNRVAKQAGKTAKKGSKVVGGGLKKGWTKTKWAAGQAGKGIVKGANATWKGIKWTANRGAVLACKGTFAAQKKLAWLEGQTIGRLQKEIAKHLKVPSTVKKLQKSIDRWLMNQGGAIQGAMEAAKILNHPKNIALVKDLSNPNKLCTQSPKATIQKVMRRIGSQYQAIKKSSQVRSRGTGPFRMSGVTIGGQFGAAKGLGGEVGIGGAIGFDGSSKAYGFTGWWAGLDVGASGSVQIGLWGTTGKRGKKLVDDISGPYIGMGYSGDGLLKMQFAKTAATIEKFGMSLGIDVFWHPLHLLLALDNPSQTGSEPIGVVISAGVSASTKKMKESLLKELPSFSAQGGHTFLFGK